MMKFLNLVALVSSVFSEARYDNQMTSLIPTAPNDASTTYESNRPLPYNFSYKVKIDDHSSFGDARVGDRQGKVSGSYHVQLPDGRHQHVTYKDDGKGYIADVNYDGQLKSNHSKPTDDKATAKKNGALDKPLPRTSLTKPNRLEELESKKCQGGKLLCHDEPSLFEASDGPTRSTAAVSDQATYQKQAYTLPTHSAVSATLVAYTTRTGDAPTLMNTTPQTLAKFEAVGTTEEYTSTSTLTTASPPALLTTPPANEQLIDPSGYKKTGVPTLAHKKPIYLQSAYQTASTSRAAIKASTKALEAASKSAKMPKASKASYPVTSPAYKKAVYAVRPYAATPAVKRKPSGPYGAKSQPYTPRAYKAASYHLPSRKPFAVPHLHRAPVLTRVAPYAAPAYGSTFYVAPAYAAHPYKAATYYQPINYANL